MPEEAGVQVQPFDPTKERRRIAIAPDGNPDLDSVLGAVDKIMSSRIGQYVGVIKINDSSHVPQSGPNVVKRLLAEYSDPGIRVGLDFKLGDVEATDRNIYDHYAEFMDRLVATVSVNSAANVFVKLRERFPGMELIAMGIPTDIKAEECLRRYGETPADLMVQWYRALTNEYRNLIGDADALPTSMAVMSFDMIPAMKKAFPELLPFTPGIRDPHMADDHQQRKIGIADAFELEVRYAVMGAQLTKGNPAKNISADQSTDITIEAMEGYYASHAKN